MNEVAADATVEGVVAGDALHEVGTASAGVAAAVLAGKGVGGGRSEGSGHGKAKLVGLSVLDAEAGVAAVFADDEDLIGAAAFEGVGDALGNVFPDVDGAGNQGAAGQRLAVEDDAAGAIDVENGGCEAMHAPSQTPT